MSDRSQSPRRSPASQPQLPPRNVTEAPPAASVPAVSTAPEEAHSTPPPPSGGARHDGPLQVAHSMVGRFLHGEVLHAAQIAEFTQDNLEHLLRLGALVPLGAHRAPGLPARPLPAEDAALAAQPQTPSAQDFDGRPGTPRAG